MRRVAAALLLLAAGAAGRAADWVVVDYAPLVDPRRLSHTGEPVETLLARLSGRPAEGATGRDLSDHRSLEPLVEPYAFVLSDLAETLDGRPPAPFVEVGNLWYPGEAQPAWVELLRARRFVVESDGQGKLRAFLPAVDGPIAGASERALGAGWPVLRHVLAAERRRLGDRELSLSVRAYRHLPASSRFLLAREAHETKVGATAPDGTRPPLDLAAWNRFLGSGFGLEGARIDGAGNVRLFGSQRSAPPTLVGRPIDLADLAVAYRAIFRGGLSSPYMSLDRAVSPHDTEVAYGGRLRDTRIGLVSLLCDVRFKTFSAGIDVLEGRDVREEVRRRFPTFRSHLERFAAHPESAGVGGQQTRLWFYPDSVDLTLSPQRDLLAMRRARMTAASERVEAITWTASEQQDRPWTAATIAEINRRYGAFAERFPELADLDEVVRLLSLFTWLGEADRSGLLLPDLDVLLDVTLPPLTTPRHFPQLLTFNALPETPGPGAVDVVDQSRVGEALERLGTSRDGGWLDPRRRVARAVSLLDPQRPDHQALIEEIRGEDFGALSAGALDLLAYRAERLRMHQLVLSRLPLERVAAVAARQRGGEPLRVFSVGIGGLDLGMDQALSRAADRSAEAVAGDAPVMRADVAPGESWKAEPPGREPHRLPDHGTGCRGRRDDPAGKRCSVRGGYTLERADRSEVLTGREGIDARFRRASWTESGPATIERFDGGRRLRYSLEGEGVRYAVVLRALPASAVAQSPSLAELPPGWAALDVVPGADPDAETPQLAIRLSSTEGTIEGQLPRRTLHRLVLGREIDAAPDRPLPGLGTLPPQLGSVDRLLVRQRSEETAAPWLSTEPPRPGEERSAVVGAALNRWWGGRPVAVAVDGQPSIDRWSAAPAAGEALLLLPDGAFQGHLSWLADEVRKAWGGGKTARTLPKAAPSLTILVSTEAPGLLGERLRELATSASMTGKRLAVYSLAGPLREDLPASLLREGRLAGIGIAVAPPAGLRRVVSDVERIRAAVQTMGPFESRLSLFTWYY